MAEVRRWQFRIGWGMTIVVLVALTVGAITQPFDNVAMGGLLVVVFGFLIASSYLLFIILPYFALLHARRCPVCGLRQRRFNLGALAWPLLQSFHWCGACGATYWRRFPWGRVERIDPPKPTTEADAGGCNPALHGDTLNTPPAPQPDLPCP